MADRIPASVSAVIQAGHFDSSDAFPQTQDSALMSRRTILDPAAEQHKQECRDQEPLRLIQFMTKHTEICFGVLLGMHILFAVITGVLYKTGYDIIPFALDRLPLDITDDPDFLKELAWNSRNVISNDIIKRGSVSEAAADLQVEERSKVLEFFDMHFEHPDGGNVLSAENLKAIRAVEDELWNVPEYQATYCYLVNSTGTPTCAKPNSLLRVFDGTYDTPPLNLAADPEFSDIPGYLNAVYSVPQLRPTLVPFLASDAVLTPTEASTYLTRSFIMLGGPLAGYSHTEDREDEQEELYKEFLLRWKELADVYYNSGVGPEGLLYCFNSMIMLMVVVIAQVSVDMMLIIGSFLFIGVFMFVHTRSGWITLLAIFSITCCFFEANFIYRVIFGYRYFGLFHLLSLFIILGIGADDIFIFVDTWKESSHHRFLSQSHRMSYVYLKAGMAMFFTSATTAIAFFVSASSPFLAVFSFGMFSGLLIVVNYFSVISFFPTVVLMYDKYLAKRCNSPCARQGEAQAQHSGHEARPLLVRFLRRPYYYFITGKVTRWVILCVFAGILATSIYYATQLEVSEERPNFFGDNTNIGQYISNIDKFQSADAGMMARPTYIVFGMKHQDISSCHFTDPKCKGETVWDENFSIDSSAAQQDILDMCHDLKNMDDATVEALHVRKNLITEEPEVACFLTEMQDTGFFRDGDALSAPYDETDWDLLKVERSDVYADTNLPAGFSQYFALSLGYWMYEEFNGTTSVIKEYGNLVGETTDGSNTKIGSFTPLWPPAAPPRSFQYGTKLQYVAIQVNTSMTVGNTGFVEGLIVRQAWEDFVQAKLDAMTSKNTLGGFHVNKLWHWFKIQQRLVSSAVIGIVIGLCVALPILVVATHNIIVGLLATLIISLITLGVIAMIPLCGWKLGLLESLNLVLVVGLSVDYVVHLAEGYARSSHSDRKRRTRDAIEEVGISVLSGAATTLGASFFMLFAVISFFGKFGLFVFSTIGFAVCYAMGLFLTLLAMIGPEGDVGSTRFLFDVIGSLRKKSKSMEVAVIAKEGESEDSYELKDVQQ